MADSLKVVHITDPHLRADVDAVLHGWHVNDAWRRIVNDAMTRHPDADLWALTGDLVDDESATGYARMNNDLVALNCPVIALAGNHDDPQAMQHELKQAHVHKGITLSGWQLHALDSHVDGSDAGCLGAERIERLRNTLNADKRPAALFIHHPPVRVNSAWMDAIGLSDRAALCQLIQSQPHVAAVICGHAHQAFETHIDNTVCWITPSTMRQFRPVSNRFALDPHANPGYRVIHLHADGRADSRIQRVPMACG